LIMLHVATDAFAKGAPSRREADARDMLAQHAARELQLARLVLLDGARCLARVREVVDVGDFLTRTPSLIFTACMDIDAKGMPVSVDSVAERLLETGQLQSCSVGEFTGGGALLHVLTYETADSALFVASRVKRNADLRREENARRVASSRLLLGQPIDAVVDELRRTTAVLRAIAGPFVLEGPDSIFAPLATTPPVVEGVIREGSLTLVSAYGSTVKTFAMLDMCRAVACGGQWLDRFSCRQGRALFVDYESGSQELRRRLQLLVRGAGLAFPLEGIEFAALPSDYLDTPRIDRPLEALAEGRALLVVDSLRASAPTVDENDSSVRVVLDRLHRIADRTRCAVVVIVHAKKSSPGSQVDEREMLRGSSAIFDAADGVFTFVRIEGRGIRVRHVKNRQGGRTIDPFLFRIEDVANGGVVLTSEDEEPRDAPARPPPLLAAKTAILRLLAREHHLESRNDVAKALDGNRGAGARGVRFEALRALEVEGLVVFADGAFRLKSEVNP
jgi:hypothetical protein